MVHSDIADHLPDGHLTGKADATPMAVGESPAVARHRLRLALRRAREAHGLTQRQVAKALDWSMSKVNRIEGGEVTMSSTDLHALLQLYGIADRETIQQLVERARASRQRGWWDQPEFREHLTPAIVQALQFERDAKVIRSFQPTLIPGTLQTPAYAAAIMGLTLWTLSDAGRDSRRKARLRRREQLLGRSDPPELLLILDESVLLREVGGPQVMREQLLDLLKLIQADRVVIRISPLTHAAVYAAFGLFTIYTGDDDDVALLYRESYEVDAVEYSPEVIDLHRQFFEQIWEQSLSTEASNHMIEARAAALRLSIDRLRHSG
jgi:transcriptional regulator with XRE-family HTH domain